MLGCDPHLSDIKGKEKATVPMLNELPMRRMVEAIPDATP